MSEHCDNIKYLYLDCVRNIHLNESNTRQCFMLWDNLIKCLNKDINLEVKDDLKKVISTINSYQNSESIHNIQNVSRFS